MNKQITIFAGCLIHDGKVLLNKRSESEVPDAHMKWEFPGGKCDFDESPQEAVKREFFEETGVEIAVITLLPYTAVNYWEYPWGKQQTLCFAFLCRLIKEHPRKEDHHVADVQWFPIEQAKKLDGLPGLKEVIEVAEKEMQSI
jgi:mutator protein MutT